MKHQTSREATPQNRAAANQSKNSITGEPKQLKNERSEGQTFEHLTAIANNSKKTAQLKAVNHSRMVQVANSTQEVAQLASASNEAYGNYANVQSLAALNAILTLHGKNNLTIDRIFHRNVTLGGATRNLLTLGNFNVDESIQNRFANRAGATYLAVLDQAISAMNCHFLKADLPVAAGAESLHVDELTVSYEESHIVGKIRAALRDTIAARPIVAQYTEGAYSVALPALNQLIGQVPAVTLEQTFNALTNPIAGNAWNGTKLINGNAHYVCELKLNGTGATRILARTAAPNLLNVYSHNGLH